MNKTHNWLVHRIILYEISKVAKKYLRGIMLDIGCGTKPYKSVFSPYVEKHIGLDYQDTLHGLSDENGDFNVSWKEYSYS